MRNSVYTAVLALAFLSVTAESTITGRQVAVSDLVARPLVSEDVSPLEPIAASAGFPPTATTFEVVTVAKP